MGSMIRHCARGHYQQLSYLIFEKTLQNRYYHHSLLQKRGERLPRARKVLEPELTPGFKSHVFLHQDGRRLVRITMILAVTLRGEDVFALWLCLLGLIPETDGLINKQLALNPGVPGNGTNMGTRTQLSGG